MTFEWLSLTQAGGDCAALDHDQRLALFGELWQYGQNDGDEALQSLLARYSDRTADDYAAWLAGTWTEGAWSAAEPASVEAGTAGSDQGAARPDQGAAGHDPAQASAQSLAELIGLIDAWWQSMSAESTWADLRVLLTASWGSAWEGEEAAAALLANIAANPEAQTLSGFRAAIPTLALRPAAVYEGVSPTDEALAWGDATAGTENSPLAGSGTSTPEPPGAAGAQPPAELPEDDPLWDLLEDDRWDDLTEGELRALQLAGLVQFVSTDDDNLPI